MANPPAGWDPNAPVLPPWVDPNSGYVTETDYDKQPMQAWYPNGQYQWDDPYMNGDALKRNLAYPRYGAYSKPDPNWRPSFFGETPPWQINPNDPWSANRSEGQWFGHDRDPTPEEKRRMDDYHNSNVQRSANHQSEREAALAAGAKLIRADKRIPGWAGVNQQLWYYPPGYKGPRVKSLGSNLEEKSISDPSVLGAEGGAWRYVDGKGNTVSGNQPSQGSGQLYSGQSFGAGPPQGNSNQQPQYGSQPQASTGPTKNQYQPNTGAQFAANFGPPPEIQERWKIGFGAEPNPFGAPQVNANNMAPASGGNGDILSRMAAYFQAGGGGGMNPASQVQNVMRSMGGGGGYSSPSGNPFDMMGGMQGNPFGQMQNMMGNPFGGGYGNPFGGFGGGYGSPFGGFGGGYGGNPFGGMMNQFMGSPYMRQPFFFGGY